MKLLRAARIKVNTSKGRIDRGETVVLDDAEYVRISFLSPDAFDVLDADYNETPVEPVKRGRRKDIKE